MTVRLALVLAATAAIALPGLAPAQDGLPPAVKARQGQMNEYAFHLGQFGAMAKGEMPYDAAMAQALADQLATLTSIGYVGYWPEGTSTEEIPGSRALPAIWENPADFEAKQQGLEEAAARLRRRGRSGPGGAGRRDARPGRRLRRLPPDLPRVPVGRFGDAEP